MGTPVDDDVQEARARQCLSAEHKKPTICRSPHFVGRVALNLRLTVTFQTHHPLR